MTVYNQCCLWNWFGANVSLKLMESNKNSRWEAHKFDIHGSVHRSMTQQKYQQDAAFNGIYYPKVYWRLNMFRAAHRSSSGALNCICSLWFIYRNKVKDYVYIIHSPYYIIIYKEYYCNIIIWTLYNIYVILYLIAVYKTEATNRV